MIASSPLSRGLITPGEEGFCEGGGVFRKATITERVKKKQ